MKTALIVSADVSTAPGVPANLGDAFLSESLAAALADRGFDVRIADFGRIESDDDPLRIALGGARIKRLSQAIKGADLVLVGGGTLLQDDTPEGPAFGGLARLLFAASTFARLHRTPLAYFGVGANPVSRRTQRLLLRAAMAGRTIWARDEWTENLLRESYGKRSLVAADAAMLAYRKTPGDEPSRSSLLLAGYPGDAKLLTGDVVEDLRKKYGSVEFISMSQGNKGDATYLTPETRAALDFVHENVSVTSAVEVFRASSAVASGRMHALYLGLLTNRPVAALGDRNKVRSFRNEFSVPALESWSDLLRQEPVLGDDGAVRAAAERAEAAVAKAAQLGRR